MFASAMLNEKDRQDSVRHVQIKMSAREIPPVDYKKLFQEASPNIVKNKVRAYSPARRSPTAGKTVISTLSLSKKNPDFSKPQTVVKTKPPVSAMAEEKKTTAVAPKNTAIVVKQPVFKKSQPVSAPAAEKKSTAVDSKNTAIAIKQPVAKKSQPVAVANPSAALPESNHWTKPKNTAQVRAEQNSVPTATESLKGKVQESSTLVSKDIKSKTNSKPVDENDYNKNISSEQAHWNAIESEPNSNINSTVIDTNSTASKLSYLYIGFALTVIGVILGLVFGRPAFLVSVVGIVFVVIGLFIQA